MATAPPPDAEAAIIGPVSTLVQRVEIFEADGETRWKNGAHDRRLVNGSVTVDYARSERRAIDVVLDNSDFGLDHDPEGFWYDKVLKAFCGVEYVDTTPQITYQTRKNLWTNPSIEVNTTGFGAIANTMTQSTDWAADGTKSLKLVPNSAVNDSYVYLTGNAGAIRAPLVAGKTYTVSASVFIPVALSGSTFADRMGRIVVHTRIGAGSYVITTSDAPAATGITRQKVTFTVPSDASEAFIRLYNGATNSATNAVYWDSIVIEEGTTSGQYYDGNTLDFGNRIYSWDGTAGSSSSTETIEVITPQAVNAVWETQVGEFMIDVISEDHFPYTVKVTGRDYTKKCLLSKFTQATAFSATTNVEDAVKAMALNAGVTKFVMPLTGKLLGRDFFYERNTERWKAMTDIATAFGYELFFDAEGYLVMREFQDPVSAPLTYILETGEMGTLVTYNKTVNDTRIYNHILVTGESSDSETIPVFAEALNTEPSSPTRIAKIGDRVFQYSSPFITDVGQAQDLANKYLAISSLEEFDLNFSGISLPWLEVGEIVQFNDPRKYSGQPTRFLLSSLSIPLGLGAMSGNAKRVTVVG